MDLFPEHSTQNQSKAQRNEDCLDRVLANICFDFCLPLLRQGPCIRPGIFYYILELFGLCFRRCVQIVGSLFNVLYFSSQRILRIARFVHIRILLFGSQRDFGAQRRLGLTKIRRSRQANVADLEPAPYPRALPRRAGARDLCQPAWSARSGVGLEHPHLLVCWAF
jgi:hypothetical protein